MKKSLDKGVKCDALFIDLFKVFDSLPHDVLLVKLEQYGFSYSSLKLISSFLSNRKTEQKLIVHIVIGKIYNLVYLEDQLLKPLYIYKTRFVVVNSK